MSINIRLVDWIILFEYWAHRKCYEQYIIPLILWLVAKARQIYICYHCVAFTDKQKLYKQTFFGMQLINSLFTLLYLFPDLKTWISGTKPAANERAHYSFAANILHLYSAQCSILESHGIITTKNLIAHQHMKLGLLLFYISKCNNGTVG